MKKEQVIYALFNIYCAINQYINRIFQAKDYESKILLS